MHADEAERDLLVRTPGRLFIDGRWQDATDSRTFPVLDPGTGRVVKEVADASVADGVRALDAAVGAQESWSRRPARVRGEILRGAFDLLMQRAKDFALLMTVETGKPLQEARGEVTYGGEFLRWFSEEAVRIKGGYQASPEGTGRMIVTHRPVGPSFLVTPWNFPLAMATRKLAPAIAAGCTSVIKPASQTPLTTLAVVALLEEAGLPPGVVNTVTTSSTAEVSGRILADPRLRKLSFTGSTPVGVMLLKQAADNVLRTSMELGGNAAFVVFEDADFDAAVRGALQAKFRNIGQACTAANRFLVHESVADKFATRMTSAVGELRIGRGTEPGVSIGPLIDQRAVAGVAELVTDAVAAGATLLAGGATVGGAGHFFQPTVLDDVTMSMRVAREEIFGPVVSIVRFADEEQAVQLANDTEYGLVSYVYTQDVRRGQRMIERLDTGMMGLNVGVVSNAAAPFGGMKQSGLGREGGRVGIHEFLETKYTLTPDPFTAS